MSTNTNQQQSSNHVSRPVQLEAVALFVQLAPSTVQAVTHNDTKDRMGEKETRERRERGEDQEERARDRVQSNRQSDRFVAAWVVDTTAEQLDHVAVFESFVGRPVVRSLSC